MTNTCCSAACSWLNQNFRLDLKDSAQGVQITIEPTDPAKAGALQNLLRSAKEFCQAFCKP